MATKAARTAEGPELFLGLVGATGTELHKVESALEKALSSVSYHTEKLRLSDLLYEIDGGEKIGKRGDPEDDRITQLQDAGNALREQMGNGAAMALGVLSKVRHKRDEKVREKQSLQCAYILNSLKHPKEVDYFRNLYGKSFILVSAFSPRDARRDNLAMRIAETHQQTDRNEFYPHAETIIKRDAREQENQYGQNVGDTFPKADLFVDVRDEDELERSITRFVELYFGNVLKTPQHDEVAMFYARASALRSGDLGRQVGAAIATDDGNIVALGTNEVPKPGGGQYWEGDPHDDRDIKRGRDVNVRFKEVLFGEIIEKLQAKGLIQGLAGGKVQEIVDDILPGTQIAGLLEFGRSVHAEMAAIVDAAFRGVSIRNCTLYTTTFPCHLCAKHIVAAGIKDVVYIEPFPKSRASELYLDFGGEREVDFRSFVGVAPRQYMQLFSVTEETPRKDNKTGEVIPWISRTASPRYSERREFYGEREREDSDNYDEMVDRLEFLMEGGRIVMREKLAGSLFSERE